MSQLTQPGYQPIIGSTSAPPHGQYRDERLALVEILIDDARRCLSRAPGDAVRMADGKLTLALDMLKRAN